MVGTAATRAPGRRTSPAAAREHSQEPPPHRDWCCSWPATWRSGSGDAEPVRAGDMEPVGGSGDAELVQRAGEGRWGLQGAGRAGRSRAAKGSPSRRLWTSRPPQGPLDLPWPGGFGVPTRLPLLSGRDRCGGAGGAVEAGTPGRPLPVDGTAVAGGPGANASLSGCSGADPLPQAEAQEPGLEGISPRGAGAVSAAGPARRGWGSQGTLGGGPTPGGGSGWGVSQARLREGGATRWTPCLSPQPLLGLPALPVPVLNGQGLGSLPREDPGGAEPAGWSRARHRPRRRAPPSLCAPQDPLLQVLLPVRPVGRGAPGALRPLLRHAGLQQELQDQGLGRLPQA